MQHGMRLSSENNLCKRIRLCAKFCEIKLFGATTCNMVRRAQPSILVCDAIHSQTVMVLSWVYLAKIKNFKDEKETIAIAKTPGHRNNRKVIESLLLDWCIRSAASQIYIESYSLCGKELPDDQHSCAGNAGSQPVPVGGSGAQIRKDLGVAEKV